MINKLFFDNDCISSFLWVNEEHILFKLYPGRIVLPSQVYYELCNPSIRHLKHRIDQLCLSGELSIKEILLNTEEYRLYHGLAIAPLVGVKRIGKGEAAAIALAKTYNGILASNNLKDISRYVKKYKLKHVTTGKILVAALQASYIDETTGNQIWHNMIARKRILPTKSFTDYLKTIDS
ncbi:MAG TPA: hypothetical protein VFF83_04085 [Clostridia bacterium]|jgi:predicted nucleic acid-binding protein|nr:hypothetical protein [Clostridia bacterium]